MTAAEPRLGVVVVNYGSHRLIAAGLDAAGLRTAGVTVVIVDNFSGAAEAEAVAGLCAERGWLLVALPANEGFGAGVNAGVQAARDAGCDTFIALNPDAKAGVEVLLRLGEQARNRPRSLVAPAMVDSTGAAHFRGSQLSLNSGQLRSGWRDGDDDPVWRNWLSGACLAFSDAAFTELGGFDAGYFLYWEDVDLSRRAAAAGMTLTLRDDLRIVHDEGGTHPVASVGSGPGRAKSDLYYFYNTRNRLRFARRHLDHRQLWRWIVATPRQSLLIWLRGGKRQLFTHPAGAWAAIQGTMVGLGPAIGAALQARFGGMKMSRKGR